MIKLKKKKKPKKEKGLNLSPDCAIQFLIFARKWGSILV